MSEYLMSLSGRGMVLALSIQVIIFVSPLDEKSAR